MLDARLPIALIVTLLPIQAEAQRITVDGRLSPAQTLTGPNYAIGAELGKQVGGNLFHSFGNFGLTKGETATFNGPATVTNIVGRVTGGRASSIDGTVRSTVAGANFYLINPSGIVFGPNAAIDVKGSFRASTAEYLRMSDGARFQVTAPDGSALSAAPPVAFGFLNATPGRITVNGSTLTAAPGQNLGLVGGPLSLDGAKLTVPAGNIRLSSVASTGEVPVAKNIKSTVTARGAMALSNGSILDVSDATSKGSGGGVGLRAGTLAIDGSEINADNYGAAKGARLSLKANDINVVNNTKIHAFAISTGEGGDIDARSAGKLSIADSSLLSNSTFGIGKAGRLFVKAGALNLTNNGLITSDTFGSGNGGAISVAISGPLSIEGGPASGAISGITSQAGKTIITVINGQSLKIDGPTGDAGAIDVIAGDMGLVRGGLLSGTSFGVGKAGNVSAKVAGQIIIDGASSGRPTGIFSDSTLQRIAPAQELIAGAGSIGVTAAGLALKSGGAISASVFLFPAGTAGNISVQVRDSLSIEGAATGIFSDGVVAGTGKKSGVIALTSDTLSISKSGVISASPGSSVAAGNIDIGVAGELSIEARGSAPGNTGIFSGPGSVTGNPTTKGTNISTGTLSIDGGVISSIGNLNILVNGSASLSGGSQITTARQGSLESISGNINLTARGGLLLTDPGTTITASGTNLLGNGGEVTVAANDITISRGAKISSAAPGVGELFNLGSRSVSLSTPGLLLLDGHGINGTGITTSTSTAESPTGGGPVVIRAGRIVIRDGGQIDSSTAGLFKGGDIDIESPQIDLFGSGSQITARSSGNTTNTSVNVFTPGGAGSIRVAAEHLTVRDGASISTEAAGGNGGSLTLSGTGLVLVDGMGTRISGSTSGEGTGGSVILNAGHLVIGGGAHIASTSSGPGKGGDIAVFSPVIDLIGLGPQITAGSTGSGDMGLIRVTSGRVNLRDGASISTEAATANGGNIELRVADFLYLRNSQITTSVMSLTGDGGNITIDPKLLVLDHSQIIAQAVRGHGGNITIVADQFVPSADSLVSASSQLGISGTVELIGPRVDLNGSLVVLSSELYNTAAVLRDNCAAQGSRPRSSLVEHGRGGPPQDTEAAVPALYLIGRDVPQRQGETAPEALLPAVQTTVRLRTDCSR